MWMLIVGLALFFAVHLVPTVPELRARLVGITGARPYSGLFALGSAVGLVLIVLGYSTMQGLGRGNPQLWVRPSWARHLTMLLMLPALILLVAAYIPSRIRSAARHPMLAAVALWAFSHLLVNGDLASVLLFGSFLVYAGYDIISANQRAAVGPLGKAQGGLVQDIVAIAVGVALYALLLFWGHRILTGIQLVP
jgi:uncharacterized membrane protein